MRADTTFGLKWLFGFIFVAFVVFKVVLPWYSKNKLAAKVGRSQGVSEVDTNWDASIATDYEGFTV